MSVAWPICRMDIHVRRMANISDMNVQATGIAAMDRATGPYNGDS